MTTGRIFAQEQFQGSGFILAPRIVATANHVIRDREVSTLRFVLDDGRVAQAERVEQDATLDVAILHLSRVMPDVFSVGPAFEGAAWQVESQPVGNDPLLTGTIDASYRPLERKGGHHIRAIQLRVEQVLGDYRGYSGSAVTVKLPQLAVVGVLVEQLLWRAVPEPCRRTPQATNVLYAVPIQDVLGRFAFAELQTQYLELQTQYLEQNRRRASLPPADQDFERPVARRSTIWATRAWQWSTSVATRRR